MIFKKYQRLRKYVDGQYTDEVKKGDLIAIVDTTSQSDCENS